MLDKLKPLLGARSSIAATASLSKHSRTGACKTNRCSTGPYCKRWFLHKFRHTYATRHLQDGIDIRTLQQWMGHHDIASTMVYLKGVRNSDIQVRLNKGSLAAFA